MNEAESSPSSLARHFAGGRGTSGLRSELCLPSVPSSPRGCPRLPAAPPAPLPLGPAGCRSHPCWLVDFYSRCSPSGWRRSRRLSSHRRYGWSFLHFSGSSPSPGPAQSSNGTGGNEGCLGGAGLSAKRGFSLRMGCLTARGTPCFSRLSRTSGDIAQSQRLEWDAVQPAGSGQGRGAVRSPESPWRPLCAGHGEGSRAGAGQAAGARGDRVWEQSPPGGPGQTGRAGTHRWLPRPRVSHGEGAPQMRVSQGPACPEMLRTRDVPEATDTGWYCPEVWAQRW